MASFPRVLVISPVKFNLETGSGITMSNLFHGWPLDRIGQIYSENRTKPNLEACTHYFQLPYQNVRHASKTTMVTEMLRQTASFITHRQQTLLGHFAHLDELLPWVKHFNPDVIYARPLDRPSFSIWLPQWLSNKLSIPYITRFLDDWPRRHEQDTVFLRRFFWRLFFKKRLTSLLTHAAQNISISNEMSLAFQKRYQVSFTHFHNCIDFNAWEPEKSDHSSNKPFRLVYLGSVKEDKELQSLLDLKVSLLKLTEKGYEVQLELFGPPVYKKTITEQLESHPVVKYGGFFPHHEKFKVLKQADLLVLPLNFDERSKNYLGYSFQTKVPEYMASGTPTLVYGPTENPNVRYASAYQWAAVVNRRDDDLLQHTLQRLIESHTWRQELGQRARKLALANHDANTIRPKFQQLIREVVNKTAN